MDILMSHVARYILPSIHPTQNPYASQIRRTVSREAATNSAIPPKAMAAP